MARSLLLQTEFRRQSAPRSEVFRPHPSCMSSNASPAESGGPDSSPGQVAGARARWFTPERALQVSLWAVGLMWTLPFLAPFKAPPIPSFHAEISGRRAGTAGVERAAGVRRSAGAAARGVASARLHRSDRGADACWAGCRSTRSDCSLHSICCGPPASIMLGGLLRREFGLERVAAMLAWFLLGGRTAERGHRAGLSTSTATRWGAS